MPTYVTHDEGIINVAKIDFESQTSVLIDADNGTLTIEGEGVSVNAPSGNIDIESIAGSIKLGENLADGQTLKIGKNGATEMIFSPHGTGSSETITLTNTSGTGTGAILLNAAAGGIDIDAASLKEVNISGGKLALVSKANAASAINLTTDNGAAETIVVTNTQGTNAGAITLNAAAGGITIIGSIFGGSDIAPHITADRVIVWDDTDKTLKPSTLANVCFLKGTKITLPDKKQINIEDLTLDDKVLTYNIEGLSELKDKTKISSWQTDTMNGSLSKSGIRNIWINPADSYLIINNKLRVTKHHLIHFKRDNKYYFNFVEQLQFGDELLTAGELYEEVVSIQEVIEDINVYNFELDKDQTYFADNYLVHHYCKLCSGYSNII